MRSTTSVGENHKQIDGPAIVMSREGAQMFFDFLAKVMGPVHMPTPLQEDGFGPEVGQFVSGWKQHTAAQGPPKAKRGSRDLPAEYVALREIMAGNGEMRLFEMWKQMHARGFWSSEQKQASANLLDITNKYPGIYRLRKGV